MEELSLGAIVKLIAINDTLWKPYMEELLKCNDLFDPLDAKGNNLDPTKEAKWKKLNMKKICQI